MNISYETKTQDNFIKLLKYIKILIHDPECSKYPFVSINKSFKCIVNMKQKDNENILD